MAQANLKRCTYCGQPLRLGIRLTPLKARIFDLVQRGGGDGIPFRDLQSILDLNGDTLKVHLYQINQAIAEAGYRIYSRGSISRLVRSPPSRKNRWW